MRTVSGPTDRIVVVGAGLAGLSAALHLRGAGREVTVVERGDGPGGLAGSARVDGFRFDTGPTVLTMPDLIDDALRCVGERIDDRLDLIRLDPVYRAFYPGGEHLDVGTDIDRTAAGIAELATPADAEGYRRYVDWVTKLYRVQFGDFIDRNLDSAVDLLRPSLLRLAALGGFGRMDAAARRFLPDPRVRRAFTFQALYAGLSPYRALALYSVISYFDTVRGAYFPRGGMHAVPQALAAAADKHGVMFRYGCAATGLECAGDQARAVRLDDGSRLPADVVVLAGDVHRAYPDLLGTPPPPVRMSPSCVVWHIGSDSAYGRIRHHNVHFGQSWSGGFADLVDRGRLTTDPSLLVVNPSRTDPGVAPPDRHTYYVLAPVPNLRDARIDWPRIAPRFRDELHRTLTGRGYRGLRVLTERFVTPADWDAAGYEAGTPFSAAHTFGQTGPFRTPNLVRRPQNVVLAGAGTTPGVGVPMALLSGRLAAERITGAA